MTSLKNDSRITKEVGQRNMTHYRDPAATRLLTHVVDVILAFTLLFSTEDNPMSTSTSILSQSNSATLPILVYASSRLYLSFLIDDRWTYKPPANSLLDLRYSDFEASASSSTAANFNNIHSEPHGCLPELAVTPDAPSPDFLSAGQGNLRLTRELCHLWCYLVQSSLLVFTAHQAAFMFNAYRRLVQYISLPGQATSPCPLGQTDLWRVVLSR
ncbi:unnamed protein product, partial [Protopolystoma xenopodis]